jgi:hypothetical protein
MVRARDRDGLFVLVVLHLEDEVAYFDPKPLKTLGPTMSIMGAIPHRFLHGQHGFRVEDSAQLSVRYFWIRYDGELR